MSKSVLEEKQQPLVSVIMPAYNAGAYIAEAINSLIGQSYQNWELLIVNDGSKDNTEAEILKFSDPRIRYFEQENKGVSAARNVGLANMQGSFFCLLDADDVYPTRSLSARLEVFQKSEDIEFVDGTVVLKNETMTKIIREKIHTFRGNPFAALLHLDETCFFGPSWMIRKLPQKVYQFRERMTHCEDLLFYVTIAENGGIYSATEEEVLFYRVSANSAMSNLKGLENGYLQLYQLVTAMPKVSSKDKNYLKRRIIRIMFLSYLRRKNIRSALRVVFKYLSL